MKKALSSFLAASALFAGQSVFPHVSAAFAQAASAPPAGQVQMDPDEYAAYDNAVNKQTTPQTQAPGLEAYLVKYPKSAVKADVLERLMVDYSQFDPAKAVTAADNVLQVSPNNLQAYTVEVVFRSQAAAAITDPAAKQAAMDQAASYAQKALAMNKPDAMSQADFDANMAKVKPTFLSTIGADALGKKDYPTAITSFNAELDATPIAQTTQPGTALQDTYLLGQAYYLSTPPDYVNCTFYTTRAASYAPAPFSTQFQPLADYCYKKYHGGKDGYQAVVTAAKASLHPPSGFTIVAAPSDADIAHKFIADTPDLTNAAIKDKEFVLGYGSSEDAEKVFATVKGKEDRIPDATVISATADQIMVAYSDDAVQSKAADFTFNMKTPPKTLPTIGTKITLLGTWTSYNQKPLMIIMSDGEEVKKGAAAPVRHPGAAHHK